MARILIDGRVLAHVRTSGVERYVRELVGRLPQAGPRHRFALARPPTRTRWIHHLWQHLWLPVRCAAGGYDLLFCPANIAPALKPARAKWVVTIHGIAYRFSPQSYGRSFSLYYSWLVPRSLNNADAIIAVSAAERRSLLAVYPCVPAEKIHVIANGVDPSVFNLEGQRGALEILQRRYGIRGDFVLAVGSFQEVKNLATLIESHRLIRDRIGAQLVLVGSAPTHPLSEGDGVTRVGYVDTDLRYFYQAAKMLVFPSIYEGFGLPPLEAMACGCPVIVSRAGALPEVCGDAAMYVDADDSQGIAAAMVEMAANEALRAQCIARGLRRAQNFTWEKTVAETMQIFDLLCNH